MRNNQTKLPSRDLPFAEYVRARFLYDPETGYFHIRSAPDPTKRAGRFCAKGYCRLSIRGRHYQASHIAWLLMTGSLPVEQIDHINRITGDDRFANLREATNALNQRNRPINPNNKNGFKGVRFCGWRAEIKVDGTTYKSGFFNTPEGAARAYDELAKKYHGDFACTNQELGLFGESSPEAIAA